jgi:hypothetical protein
MDTVPAVCPVIEVDPVVAVAATLSLSHDTILQRGSRNGSHAELRQFRTGR